MRPGSICELNVVLTSYNVVMCLISEKKNYGMITFFYLIPSGRKIISIYDI